MWRDSVDSRWTPKPVALNADDAAWSDTDVEYEPGIDFRAKNDGANLYLHLTADGSDGRALMSGTFRQDLTFWFYGSDGKTRSFGLRLPFSRLQPPLPGSWQILGQTPPFASGTTPELLLPSGVAVSTGLPQGLRLQGGLAGRDPVYTLVVPLKALRPAPGKPVRLDFLAAPVEPGIKKLVSSWDQDVERAHSRRGGSAAPDDDDGTALPGAVKVRLAVRLSAK